MCLYGYACKSVSLFSFLLKSWKASEKGTVFEKMAIEIISYECVCVVIIVGGSGCLAIEVLIEFLTKPAQH